MSKMIIFSTQEEKDRAIQELNQKFQDCVAELEGAKVEGQ